MYFVIYDEDWPSFLLLSEQDIHDMADDIELSHEECRFSGEMIVRRDDTYQNALSVLREYWGLFIARPEDEPGEFLIDAEALGLREDAIEFLRAYSPRFIEDEQL